MFGMRINKVDKKSIPNQIAISREDFCQDYSVALLSGRKGIAGKKGVLFDIRDTLIEKNSFALENKADRSLKIPASARGEILVIMLKTFDELGYTESGEL